MTGFDWHGDICLQAKIDHIDQKCLTKAAILGKHWLGKASRGRFRPNVLLVYLDLCLYLCLYLCLKIMFSLSSVDLRSEPQRAKNVCTSGR